jgi:hypothetical protein
MAKLYCDLEGLPYMTGSCPVSDERGHALKGAMVKLDEVNPSFRWQLLDHLKRLLRQAGKEVKYPDKNCQYCGEPSTQYICAVCRIRIYQQQKTADRDKI